MTAKRREIRLSKVEEINVQLYYEKKNQTKCITEKVCGGKNHSAEKWKTNYEHRMRKNYKFFFSLREGGKFNAEKKFLLTSDRIFMHSSYFAF